ncbi:MAG: zinc-dependent metalloprotease [Proteobacteria bacterium]|nr:zinc-dependent metalloprotease [Pseudomonadota bacterium]
MIIKFTKLSMLALLTSAAVSGCGKPSKQSSENFPNETKVDVAPTVVTQTPTTNEILKSESQSIRVLGATALKSQIDAGLILPNVSAALVNESGVEVASSTPGSGDSEVAKDSLFIQIPVQLLGHGHLFGGVITTVSDKESSTLGRLKLTDLPPLHVRPFIANGQGEQANPSVVLVGCVSKCTETSEQQGLIAFPVLGQTPDNANIVLDVAKFGESLDLMSVLDPGGEYSGLKTIATRTTSVDMTNATIVWDVEHKMVPKDAVEGSNPAVTLIGARYYLKLESSLNSAFARRKQIPGVGFFTTSNSADELITRFSQTDFNGKPIHYFIKNVPEANKGAFAASFDAWNKTFEEETGKELISYEFISDSDPKGALIVTGDARFNVLEWDLVNQAPYGGLGPSMASQTTGQTFSANVLVQGPTIETIYREWFKVALDAQELIADGKSAEADKLIITTRNKIFAKLGDSKDLPAQQLKLGSKIDFRHHAQDARLEDRIAARQDFFDLPQGETYESYMKGYYFGLVTHELGHNLGLRHNFKGNLLATADGVKPSGSIMEYLNREFRHKDSIGTYDQMAIAYGYSGVEPVRKDIFCTDENVVDAQNPTFSAECSRDDATNDAFAYFGKVIDRALDRVVAPNSVEAPTWTVADLSREFSYSLTGRIAYGTSAEATSKTWLTFAAANRPRRASAISHYVFKEIQDQLCSATIRNAAEKKSTPEAKEATLKNLKELDAVIEKIGTDFKVLPRIKCY